jgi:hypothetical protein
MGDSDHNSETNAIITQPYKNMGYTHEMELFFSEIGEDCHIISSLHMMCHRRYKNKETYFNIPIITITAFIGFISGLNLSYEYMHVIIGSLSLFASLLKSYFSYLKISQKGENHRISYIQYEQIYSDIQVELALEPQFRQNPSSLMNLVRVKLKNLNEVSEIIHEDIKKELEEKIKKLYYFENEFTNDKKLATTSANTNEIITKKPLRKPSILNIVKKIKLYEDYESEAFTRYRHNEGSNFNNISIICNDNVRNDDVDEDVDRNYASISNGGNNGGNNYSGNDDDNDSCNNTKNSLKNNSKLDIVLNENIIQENGILL